MDNENKIINEMIIKSNDVLYFNQHQHKNMEHGVPSVSPRIIVSFGFYNFSIPTDLIIREFQLTLHFIIEQKYYWLYFNEKEILDEAIRQDIRCWREAMQVRK